jgi:hypothetical protein
MRLLAAALLAGLALIAAAITFHAIESGDGGDTYADAEAIARAWTNVSGLEVASVCRVAGPFVHVKSTAGRCFLIDVSTQYEGEGGADAFWVGANSGDDKQIDC